MKCALCKNGETRPGEVDVVMQRSGCTVIVKRVPADVCENCGEHYLADPVAARVLAAAEEAASHGAEVEIRGFAA